MTYRLSLPILLLTLITAFPAFSQDNSFEILAGIISSGGNVLPADAAANEPASALEVLGILPSSNAGATGSPLDFVTATGIGEDPFTALAGVYSKQGKVSGFGALDVISGAYESNFYMSGVFDSMDFSNNISQPSVIAPLSGYSFYSPEWGRITSGFGYREQFGRMHKGVDIAMNVGDTVRVALPGIVERVAYDAKGYGHYIIVKHDNGMETRYAHLSVTIATPGQHVMAGQPIALSGNTGNSTGPHLHFETRYNGNAIDPESVFNFSGSQSASYLAAQPPAQAADTSMATGFNGSKKNLTGKSTYVVREGDTPKKIATRANISVLRLCQLNFITEDQKLQPGTMLKLK